MRNGFTTGSCAAAASKAAAYMLLLGIDKDNISIITPSGLPYETKVMDITKGDDYVSCAVIKDSGDDPDVTNGMHIYSKVTACPEAGGLEITIEGGEGVGVVTRPGLDQEVGCAAINHVPRQMITEEVTQVAKMADFTGRICVTISVPGGEEIAMKTFNPKLGIEGGISIIGTSGIVEPMSTKAIIDTIRLELTQRRTMGFDYVAITPGNYGRDYIYNTYGYDIDKSVKCSNFIGDSIDIACELGFSRLLLIGHIGKLIKLSGGIMNTHSKEADCRMELLCAAALIAGISSDGARRILDCVVTEEAIQIIKSENLVDSTMKVVMDKIMAYLDKRAAGRLEIECITYSNDYGQLATSKGADKWLTLLAQEQEQ